MLERLLDWDKEFFLYLNSINATWLDPVMLFLSSYFNWILGFLIMLALILYKGTNWRKTASIFYLLSLGMSALLTNIIKIIIARPRPIHNQEWKGLIHAIEFYEGSYSFFSSHSATTFAMCVFFFLYFKGKRWYGYIALVWATIVAYSRIYLGKHFPLDVFCGIVFGSLVAIAGYKIYEYYIKGKTDIQS